LRLLPHHLCPRTGGELINVPVLRFALLLALLLALAAAGPAGAAEPFGAAPTQAQPLSPGVTPEQAAAMRQLIGSDPEAAKAVEEALRRKAEERKAGRRGGRRPGTAGEAEKRDLFGRGSSPAGEEARAARIAAEPRYDWTKSTYVGGLFGKRLTARERETLPHFGHDLFAFSSVTLQPHENLPVSPGYVIGPGDEIVVRMWGRVEGTQRMVVDRDGKIFFPKFGSLYVAGKTFEEVKAFLMGKVSTIAEVSSDVGMGQMKGIRVSARRGALPGGTTSARSTRRCRRSPPPVDQGHRVAAPEPGPRGGGTAGEVDLYDFLLKGDTRGDIHLLRATSSSSRWWGSWRPSWARSAAPPSTS
jgi:hypothetical protein